MRNLFIIFVTEFMIGSAYGASIAYLNGSGVTDLSDGTAWDGGV